MTDVHPFYRYWNDLLDGVKPPPKFFDGDPQGGCFYMKARDGKRVPVRIDKVDARGQVDLDGGKVVIWVDGRAIDDGKYGDVWQAVGRSAVTGEVYEVRIASGLWPDEAAAKVTVAPASGGNNPPPDEVHELLPYTLAQIADWFKKMGETFTKAEQITAASDHAKSLRDLVSKAKKLHTVEKAPHLEAGKAVDTKYLRPCDAAEKLLATIGKAVAAFEKTQTAAREAEAARLAAEAARAAKALQDASDEEREQAVKAFGAAAAAVDAAAGPVVHKSSTGKRGFKVKEIVIAVVVDQDALYAAARDRPEVQDCLRNVAQRALDSGTLLPGVQQTKDLKAT